MKPVVGFLLIFVGLAIGYLVLIGKLPSSSTTPVSAPVTTLPSATGATGGGPDSGFKAYRGAI